MISLETAELLKTVVALILAYILISTVTGALQAWVASLMGDDTARKHGWMSLNPFIHIDPFSLFLLPITYIYARMVIGLSRPVPIFWGNIRGRLRGLKMAIVALAQPLAILFLLGSLVVGTVLIFALFKDGALLMKFQKIFANIFGAVFGFSVWFLPYQFLMSLTQIYFYEKGGSMYSQHQQILLMIIPFLGAFLLRNISYLFLVKFLMLIERGLASFGMMLTGG